MASSGQSDEGRQARLARNEALFRQVNESLEQAVRPGSLGDPLEFICECADATCAESVTLVVAAYEQIRSVSSQALVVPGHFFPEVERIVEQHDHYWIVAKVGRAADVMEALDPRDGL